MPQRTHGMTGTPEYTAWRNMKARCMRPTHPEWPNYGGRGITVCADWLEDFREFFAHVGRRPSPHMSIDRIDNGRGYEPGNVRWADQRTQNLNTRMTHEDRSVRSRISAMKRWHPERFDATS